MRHALFARLRRYAECFATPPYAALLEIARLCIRTTIITPKQELSFASAVMQRGRRAVLPAMTALILGACGYHLVGHGDGAGAVPADVTTVSVEATGAIGNSLARALKREMAGNPHYQVVAAADVDDEASHAVIRIEQVSESFAASAYDASGLATQYRMTITANVRLFRAGTVLWESGAISKSGDVFTAGGPTGIESSRERIRKDLQKEWTLAAWARISSGF